MGESGVLSVHKRVLRRGGCELQNNFIVFAYYLQYYGSAEEAEDWQHSSLRQAVALSFQGGLIKIAINYSNVLHDANKNPLMTFTGTKQLYVC